MRNRNKNWFFVIIVVTMLGCNLSNPLQPAPTFEVEITKTAPVADVTFPMNTIFPADNGNSTLLFEEETTVRPVVDEIMVHELSQQELSEYVQDTPPPDNRKIIISLEILPSEMTFAPPATVKFDVSGRDDLERGDVLEFYTFDEEKREWVLLGKADVDHEGFAVARILHTSIYAVMEKVDSSDKIDTPPTSSDIHPTSTQTLSPVKTLTPTRTPTKTITPSITPSLTPLPSAEISGSIWEDTNKNGSIDFGETTGIGGVTVNLGTGSCDSAGFRQTSTNSSGFYDFTNLAAGTYCVSVYVSDPNCNGYTTSTNYTISLGNGQSVSRNFGYVAPICVD